MPATVGTFSAVILFYKRGEILSHAANVQQMCRHVHICCTFHIGRLGTGDGPTRNPLSREQAQALAVGLPPRLARNRSVRLMSARVMGRKRPSRSITGRSDTRLAG
jgi:hypothetical protein